MLLCMANETLEWVSFLHKNLLPEEISNQFVETGAVPLGIFSAQIKQIIR